MLEHDRPLLEGYRRGDRAALDVIYRRLSVPVLRSLSRSFGVRVASGVSPVHVSPLDLDAAHQETFMRVFSDSARLHYDGLKPFEPYVLAIARSAAIDVLRAQGKLHREALPLDDVADSLFDPTASPEAQALQAEAEALVKGFLSTLSPEDRTFATARFIEGQSQERAGALCGLSRQEARTREAKLKALCLKHLATKGFPDGPSAKGALVSTLVLGLFIGR